MAVNILLKRSATANKRPVGASMAFGELNLNYDAATGGLYYKDTAGAVVKVGPCQVSATAPNSSPAGSSGNSAGEFWFDTATQTLKLYDGTAWVEAGGSVQGVTGTAPITVDNTDPLNPVVGITTGTTSARGAVQLTDSTSSTSTTTAATPNSVKSAYDLAAAALPKSGGTMTGNITFNAGQIFPGVVTSVTAAGSSAISVDNTDPTQPVLSVAASSTTSPGVVQLNDTTSSSSVTEALTANQGRVLQTQIDALVVSSNLTFAGTIDASTGDMFTVSTEGAAAGFTIGNPLPSPAAGNSEYFVIVTVPGTMTPPGGSSQECHQGDWWLSDGTIWNFLDVGYNAPYATTATPGVVQLATDAEVQAGVNLDHAVTPAGLQSKVSNSVATTSNTVLASATAAKTAYDAGIQGQTDAAAAQATADAALPKAGGTMTGDITFNDAGEGIIFSDASSIVAISDSNSTTSSTTAASSTAVKSAYDLASAAVPDSSFSASGDLLVGTGAGTYANLTAGAADTILSSDGAGNLVWVDNSAGDITALSYTAPITVDATDPQVPVIGISDATLFNSGAVQLYSGVDSTNEAKAATPLAAKTAYDAAVAAQATADAALPKAGGTMTGNIVFQDAGEGVQFNGGSSIYAISDSTSLTSSTTAASATAVKAAYDAATVAAANTPMAASNVLFVNPTTGNNATAVRGTAKPFATLTAAIAAASDGDFIYMAPGTYTENPVINKGVVILGAYQDQGTWQGTKILGNTQLNLAGSVTRNCAIYNVYFISANSTPAFEVIAHATAAGNTIIGNCMFTQATASDVNQFAFRSAVSNWVRSIYTRNCAFDGNVKHNAGTAAGASGYLVMDNTIGTGSSSYYYYILTGTVEFRNPSQALSPIYQTGGVVTTADAFSFTNNSATTTSIFGGTGFSYKGSAASVGTGTVYFGGGYNTAGGKVDIGANLVYGWTNLNVTPANLTISGSAVAYTTAVPAAANIVVTQQTRPQYDLLKTTSSVTAANQLGTVVDSSTGIFYSVAAYDAGTY